MGVAEGFASANVCYDPGYPQWILVVILFILYLSYMIESCKSAAWSVTASLSLLSNLSEDNSHSFQRLHAKHKGH